MILPMTCSYLVITAHIGDIGHRQAIEDSFVSALKAVRVEGSRGVDIWPPTRNMTKEQKALAFLESDSDCLISISLKKGTIKAQFYEVVVLEKFSASNIWIGTASTRSIIEPITAHSILTGDVDMSAMFDSMAREIVNQLVKDGVLRRRGTG